MTAKSKSRLKGKILGFQKFRDLLGDNLGKVLPELGSAIEDIKKRTTPDEE